MSHCESPRSGTASSRTAFRRRSPGPSPATRWRPSSPALTRRAGGSRSNPAGTAGAAPACVTALSCSTSATWTGWRCVPTRSSPWSSPEPRTRCSPTRSSRRRPRLPHRALPERRPRGLPARRRLRLEPPHLGTRVLERGRRRPRRRLRQRAARIRDRASRSLLGGPRRRRGPAGDRDTFSPEGAAAAQDRIGSLRLPTRRAAGAAPLVCGGGRPDASRGPRSR